MTVKIMNTEILKKKIKQKGKFVLIDCREPYKSEKESIPKSILIPCSKIDEEDKKIGTKDSEIVTSCQNGIKSITATFFLSSPWL